MSYPILLMKISMLPLILSMFLVFSFTLTGPSLIRDSSSMTTTSPPSSAIGLTASSVLAKLGIPDSCTQPVSRADEALGSKFDFETIADMLLIAKLMLLDLEKASSSSLLGKIARNSFFSDHFHPPQFHLSSNICCSSFSTLLVEACPAIILNNLTCSTGLAYSTSGILRL